ncbi:FtsW/RodA/SpoVE family cell cycle protein [Candidatus Epulonipiscium viviparus]|uniref:FtsW/RodA/SpoVE family cell cycle protein n=1 Tax=Candidatus Epulonipiscium viviparus TaxID=420336 RepID=UPI0027380829|nr:FtsW/RodA/SpoVE family cell cycle protein [Candidatus Epulopiscium viviparus]
MDLLILLSRYIISSLAVVIFVLILTKEKIRVNVSYTLLYKLMMALFSIPMFIIMLKNWDKASTLLVNWVLGSIIITTFYWVMNDKLELMGSVIVFLVIISMIMLNRLNCELARQQIIFLTIAVLVANVVFVMFPLVINKHIIKLYIPAIIILLLLPFVLGRRIYGALNWVNIGNISFQPSEIGKVMYILIAAYLLSEKKLKKSIWILGSLTAGICLIFLIQRDLGAAFLYIGVFLVLFYIYTMNIRYLLAGGIVCGVGAAIFVVAFPHVQERVLSWVDPFRDVLGSGYQMAQGLFAMGTWGVLGSGIGLGTPKSIPLVTTDFIFTAIVEELGVIVACLVIFSYFCLGIFGVAIALDVKSVFLQYIAIGCVSFITLQSFLILGGVLQIIPLTGVTLPFVSYGGSSILSSVVMVVVLFYLPSYDNKLNKGRNKGNRGKNERKTTSGQKKKINN